MKRPQNYERGLLTRGVDQYQRPADYNYYPPRVAGDLLAVEQHRAHAALRKTAFGQPGEGRAA